MSSMKHAFDKAGIKGTNKTEDTKMQHKKDFRKDRRKSKEERFEENLQKAFGENFVQNILNFKHENYNNLVENLKQYVKKHAQKFTSSQLRNIFSRVKGAKSPFELQILRPKLAYVVGREKNLEELVFLLDTLLKNVDDKNMKNFQDFFEGIIAYHKYYNPSDKKGR